MPPSEKKKKEKYANAEQLNNSKYNYEKVTETPTAEARSQEIWWTLLQYASTLRIYSALFFFSPHGEKRGIVMGEEEEERWSAIANHTGT